VGFGLEGEIGCGKFFAVAQHKVASGFEVQVQALGERDSLRGGKLGEDVHAKDAIEASQVSWASEIHLRKGDEVAEARLREEMLIDSGEVVVQQGRREGCEFSLGIEAALGKGQCALADVAGQDVNGPRAAEFVDVIADGEADGVRLFSRGTSRAQDAQTLPALVPFAGAQGGENFFLERRERRGVAEETGLSVEQLLEQALALGVGRLQSSHEIGDRTETPGFEVVGHLGNEHILRTVQKDSGLPLEQQAQFRQLVVENEVNSVLLPTIRSSEMEAGVH